MNNGQPSRLHKLAMMERKRRIDLGIDTNSINSRNTNINSIYNNDNINNKSIDNKENIIKPNSSRKNTSHSGNSLCETLSMIADKEDQDFHSKNSNIIDEEMSIDYMDKVITYQYSLQEKGQEDFLNANIDIEEIKRKYFDRIQLSKNQFNPNLPIHEKKNNIVSAINAHEVCIIEALTGTGKSTQVPYYILEDRVVKHKQCANIYVTQPRRIAARAIAKRVCQEHEWDLGTIVGYRIGQERVVGPDTMLTFCTSGVLLEKLIQEKSIDSYSHIIIDEVHERDADTDLLLMIIKMHMLKHKSSFKLILMSATLNTSKLQDYLTIRYPYGHERSIKPVKPSIGLPSREYKIDVIYFNQFLAQIKKPMDFRQPEFELCRPKFNKGLTDIAVELIINYIPKIETFQKNNSILVFLPGLYEINLMHRLLNDASDCLDISPLHSCLATSDQNKAISDPEPGKSKVILATNIAESSITVRNVAFVIDFCLTKVLMKDYQNNFPNLKLQWSSQDQTTQRAGRTGRCCAGTVFRMVPEDFYKKFQEFATPELLIAPIELSVLRVKKIETPTYDTYTMLGNVLDPPKISDISCSILELKQIGALTCEQSPEKNLPDGNITRLGRVISSIPIDVNLSKLVVIGHAFNVLSDAILIAACLSTNRSVVKVEYENDLESYKLKLNWAAGSNSDLIVCLAIVKEYKEQIALGKSYCVSDDWCNSRHIDSQKLKEVLVLEKEIEFRLAQYGILLTNDLDNFARDPCEDELFLKIAMAAAFYPNYFQSLPFDKTEVKRDLMCQDPRYTVMMSGFPLNYAHLYLWQLYHQLKHVFQSEFDFITNNSKVILRIYNKNETISMDDERAKKALGVDGLVEGTGNGVLKEVYYAIKSAQLNTFYILPYFDLASRERNVYYTRKSEEYRPKGIMPPSNWRIIMNRNVDNSHLVQPNRSNDQNYIEIEINEEQTSKDIEELTEFESNERQQLKVRGSFQSEYKHLRGPESPILMRFCALQEKICGCTIEVEKSSVNSVLLDVDYEMNRKHLLIAANVTQQGRNASILSARHTSLMPNIRGLAELLALLFAPNFQIKWVPDLKTLVGASFGLYWNKDGCSLNRRTDIDLLFDVLIEQEDLDMIKNCRRAINDMFEKMTDANPINWVASEQKILRNSIMNLIRKRRKTMEQMKDYENVEIHSYSY